jgi:hypothetical protein
MVADGNLTEIALASVYSSVVSLRGACTLVFIGEINDLVIWATDVGSTYLEELTKENVCIIAGPDFGELELHLLIICKAL